MEPNNKALLSRRLGNAAFVCSILAVLLFFICYLSIPLAATAILLALLSRGSGSLSGKGKFTVVLSFAGMILSAVITFYAAYTILHTPALRSEIEKMIEYYLPEYAQENTNDSFFPSHDSDQHYLQDPFFGSEEFPTGGEHI